MSKGASASQVTGTVLSALDENQHPPGDSPRWQENYFLLGRDESVDATVYLHISWLPGRGQVEAKAAVQLGDQRASTLVRQAGSSFFDLPGIGVDVKEAFAKWHVMAHLSGDLSEPGGWVAERSGGATQFGFDLMVTNSLGPIDWRAAAAELGTPDVVLDHYEVPCVWEGAVWCGAERVEAKGQLVRDHSWGERDVTRFDLAWWTPMVFDDATAFVSGFTMVAGGQYVGLTFIDTGTGPSLHEQPWVRIVGLPEPAGYTSADWRCTVAGHDQIAHVKVRTHIPVRYPHMGDPKMDVAPFLNDAVGEALWAGRRGLGVIELIRH